MMALQITNDIHKGRLAAVSLALYSLVMEIYISLPMSTSEFELAMCLLTIFVICSCCYVYFVFSFLLTDKEVHGSY